MVVGQWLPLQSEKIASLPEMEALRTWPEDYFLSPFMQRRREMAHPVLTKGFLQLSSEAAMLPGPSVEAHLPPPVPPFLLVQNLSPKDIAGSDFPSITRKLYDIYMRLSRIISEPAYRPAYYG